MIFVIKYDRRSGQTERLGQFEDDQMALAQKARYEAEIDARHDRPSPEIVVLSADSEANLRRSHSKYFGDDAIRANIMRNA